MTVELSPDQVRFLLAIMDADPLTQAELGRIDFARGLRTVLAAALKGDDALAGEEPAGK
jgi:hypothetical protein